MEKDTFEILRQFAGNHKKAADFIGLSYTRYNEWRWRPDTIPASGKRLLELAVDKIQSTKEKLSNNLPC